MTVCIRATLLSVLTLVLLFTGPSEAVDKVLVSGARILEYGIYDSDINAFIRDDGVADHSKILSSNFRLVKATDRIEAELGIGFGISYVISGRPEDGEVAIAVVVEHPPLFNPKTAETYLFSRTEFKRAVGVPAHAIWSFDEGWTLCPGTWTIRIEYQGRLLAKHIFSVGLKR